MDELLQYFEMLLQYAQANAQNLNPESQQVLAQFIAQFQQLIEQNMQQAGGESPIPEGNQQTQPAGMPSSNVEGFSYDPKTGRMYVRFLGDYPNREGPVYAYENVPRNIFDLFRQGAIPARTKGKNRWGEWWKGKVPSLGASLYTLIKNQGYQYSKVS